jgi:hypothetical protein
LGVRLLCKVQFPLVLLLKNLLITVFCRVFVTAKFYLAAQLETQYEPFFIRRYVCIKNIIYRK